MAGRLLLVISPYATRAAVEKLFKTVPVPPGLQIVTSWNASSLLAGAADPELYPFLKQVGGRLYLHTRIHLKLYILSTSEAVLSTGNLTLAGMGLTNDRNIELSSQVMLNRIDWMKIYKILRQSEPVTDEIYASAQAYVRSHCSIVPHPSFSLPKEHSDSDNYSYLALPAIRTPMELWTAYSRQEDREQESNWPSVAHDLDLYRIPSNLSHKIFFSQLEVNFKIHPFTNLIVNWLQEQESASFGQLKAWIQANCSDRPTPYRRDLTSVVQALFEWLSLFYVNISWSTPGRHSQVLKWKINKELD